MLIRKIYNLPAGWVRKVNERGTDGKLLDATKPEGACLNAPPVKGVAILHTGTHAEQNFGKKYVEQAIAEGWLSLGKGVLTIHAQGAELRYRILRGPGRWCLHCGEKLSDDDHPKGELARRHVAAAHPGVKSPDASNPAGYKLVAGYECILEEKQHELFKAKPGDALTINAVAKELLEQKRARRRAMSSLPPAAATALFGLALLLFCGMPDMVGPMMLGANFVFNMAKGRAAELYNRVDLNDPAAAALYVIPLEASGLEAQSALEDSDTFAEVVDGTTNEAATGGWNRKTITDTDIAAFAPDDTNNRVDLVIADQTWTAVSGNASGALVVAYASVGSPTDAQLVPLTHHDFAITPDGSDVTSDVPATGFYRAS